MTGAFVLGEVIAYWIGKTAECGGKGAPWLLGGVLFSALFFSLFLGLLETAGRGEPEGGGKEEREGGREEERGREKMEKRQQDREEMAKRHRRRWAEAVLLALLFLAGWLRMGRELEPSPLEAWVLAHTPPEEDSGKKESLLGEAEGRLLQAREKNGYLTLVLSDVTVRAGGERLEEKRILVNVSEKNVSEKNLSGSGALEGRGETTFFPGMAIRAQGELELFSGARNPGEFDARLYYRSQKIRCRLRAEQVSEEGGAAGGEGEAPPLARQAESFRSFAGRALEAVCCQEDRGIFQAVLLGDRSRLEEETEELFEDNGIAHILAISGLHVSLIGLGLYGLLRGLGLGYGWAGVFSALLLLFYGFVTGFGASVFRAIFMILCSFLALWLGRSYDPLSAMGLSLFFLALDSPFLLFTGGLQLSYGAVFAIGMESERRGKAVSGESPGRLRGREKNGGKGRKKAAGRLWEALSVSLAVELATLPMLLYHFFAFPPWSVLLNLLVIPLMAYAAGSGLLAMALFGGGLLLEALWEGVGNGPAAGILLHRGAVFLGQAAVAAIGPGHFIFALYRLLCGLFRKLPFAKIAAGRPAMVQIILYYVLLFWWYRGLWREKENRPAKGEEDRKEEDRKSREGKEKANGSGFGSRCGSSAALLLAMGFLLLCPVRGLEVWFLDVGQGDGIFLRTESAAILYDCGSSQRQRVGRDSLVPFLESRGVTKLTHIFVSHGDKDHVNGIEWLLEEEEEIRVENLVLPEAGRGQEVYERLEALAAGRGTAVRYMEAGEEETLGRLNLVCLFPERGEGGAADDRNGHSLVLSVSYGEFRMLLTGDIGAGEERYLAEKGLPFDSYAVLKAAHHGSGGSNSSEFLERVRPQMTLLSYGEGNSYGHPAPETVERLRAQKTDIWRTARSGAVCVRTDGRRMTIEGFAENEDGAGGE